MYRLEFISMQEPLPKHGGNTLYPPNPLYYPPIHNIIIAINLPLNNDIRPKKKGGGIVHSQPPFWSLCFIQPL